MWVSKLESDDLNPVFKHVLTWTDFVKFGWVKQRGKSPGGQIGQPQYHSTPLQDQWMLATCTSLLLSLILTSSRFRGGVETNHTCVCLTCMTGQLRLCGGLRVYGMAPLPVVSVLPGCSSPWEQTHAVLHHFRYLIQQHVFCCRHTCSLVQETSIWIPQCPQMCWCVCFPVCRDKCVCMIAMYVGVGRESNGRSRVWVFFGFFFTIFPD